MFVDRKGKPIPFWVHHAQWRNKYAPDILKYGGKIVGDIADADYAVIFREAKGSWDYLRTAVEVETTAVKPSYITECIARGKLVNSSRFSFEGAKLKDDSGNAFVAKLADLRAQSRGKRKKVLRKEATSSEDEEEEEEESESDAAPTKKTPKKRFTHQELTEAHDYLEELFEKDPNMTNEAVYQALEQQVFIY